MKIVTSFSPTRSVRQNQCLDSWLRMGCKVVGVQSPGESDKLAELYQNVEFVETDLVGDLFGKPHFVRIKALIDQAVDEPVLILNSDIEIRMSLDKFVNEWETPEGKKLKVGIRWDANPKTGRQQMFKWGIDAFLVTPEIAKALPDVGLAIGCPAWDYWIPFHMHGLGYQIVTNKGPGLIHVVHDRNWSQDDYRTGLSIMEEWYGPVAAQKPLADFIQRVTGRRHVRNTRWAR